jgi:outer membrane protein
MKHQAIFTYIVTAVMFGTGQLCNAETWTYQQCVEYARANNINLQQSRLNSDVASVSLEEAKAQWQPTLDFTTQHSVSNGPWRNGDKTTYNGSAGFNAAWTVWDGGQRSAQIKRSRIDTQIADLETDDVMRTLETDLLSAYLNILYCRESIDIYKEALQLSEAQADRCKQLMNAGRASKVDYAQLQAEAEQQHYNLSNAIGTYDNRRVELKRLLELGIDTDLTLAEVILTDAQVTDSLPPIAESYQMALATDKKLQALSLQRDASSLDIDIANAQGRPNIALTAGVGTSYYAPGEALGTQLKQSFNEQVGLAFSLPIFDAKKKKTAVAKAKIEQLNASLDEEARRNEIARNVEGAYIELRSNQSRFAAAKEQLSSAQLSSELVNEQFNLGLVNAVELLNANNNLIEAQHSVLQARFMALLERKLIEFYRTAEINL